MYQKNLQALKEGQRDIYMKITEKDFVWNDTEALIVDAKNGDKIVVYNGDTQVYLNSRYNPKAEADKYTEELDGIEEKALLTLFGFANGDFARSALAKVREDNKVVIYEPSIAVFMQVLHNIDVSDVLANRQVSIVVEGINTTKYDIILRDNIFAYNKKTNKHIILPKYGQIFKDSFELFSKKTLEAYQNQTIYANTGINFGERICRNNFLNMRFLPGCRAGDSFINVFPKDMPVIVVSAGPSLAKNKHLLKDAKGKALIAVVDTAIPTVMSMGVTPDMIFTLDYKKSTKHFTSDGLSKVPLVAENDSSSTVLEFIKPENMIFCSAESLLWTELFEKAGSYITGVEVGGSVATMAIACMMRWGFRKIILMGQDLTFTDGVVRVGKENTEFDFSTGVYSYVKGINGEDQVIRNDYLLYLRWIENVAYTCPNVEFIDATEGGALIEHTQVMTLAEAIDKYCTKEYDIESIIQSVPRLFQGENINIIKDTLEELKIELTNLRKHMKNGAADCRRGSLMLSNKNYNVKELKKINAAMEKLDERLVNCKELAFFDKIIHSDMLDFETDMYMEENDHIKESIRMYDKCEKYYTAIADACPKLIGFADECLAGLKEYN